MTVLLSKIIKINNLHAIGITVNEHGQQFYVLTVRKKGHKIEIVSKSIFHSFEALAKVIDHKLPIILVVSGKGILNKKINFNQEADINWFKNIDFNTIYHTSLKSTESTFMSFCRKNIVDDAISQFQKGHYQIADVYIGSLPAALIYDAIGGEKIYSGDLELVFENGKLFDISKQLQPSEIIYAVGNEEIAATFVPLYGTIVHFFIQSKEITKTSSDNLKIEEIVYKKAFNHLGVAMLAGFLVALLSSYLLIQYYSTKNAELNLEKVYANRSYQEILDMEKQREEKLKILSESGIISGKFRTFYAYEIIKEIPQDIILSELKIAPVHKEEKANQKIHFESNTIVVKGETYNEASFNHWMQELKKLTWLQHFEIISLKKDKKNKSHFEVKITMKNV